MNLFPVETLKLGRDPPFPVCERRLELTGESEVTG
jgi:hypothetical protein